ncbi:MAG: hypothetical protein MJK04_20680, partial [Psychrosphaera sp.]|nr:hypothetical protein [Psychrosphaera sp.]
EVYLIGTTPPRAGLSQTRMTTIANKLIERLHPSSFDGVIVYDIQDESCRNNTPRPFPFKKTVDPRVYSKLLSQLSNQEVITYKSVSHHGSDCFDKWLTQTQTDFSLQNLVLVGSPSTSDEIRLSLSDACQSATNSQHSLFLGGVTIAERHAQKGNEHQRLLQTTQRGAQFFISQAVYDAKATIDLLTCYAKLCASQHIKPSRVILTFTPCGGEQTLSFMNWLGISIPDDAKSRLLGAQNPLFESLRICQENLKHILSHCGDLDIPLGLNIESLTNRKTEIDASVRLFHLLKHTMSTHLSNIRQAKLDDEDVAVVENYYPVYQRSRQDSGIALR